jgi:hypothetical protein
MSWDLFQWISIVILWWLIVKNLRIMHQVKRRWQAERIELVEITGLSPLQVQVAMDAAMAIFHQRIEEMRQPHDQ